MADPSTVSTAATTSAADMAAMMASYGNPSNLNPLLMPFMPLAGMLGAGQSALPIQNVMKDFYEQSMKNYIGN